MRKSSLIITIILFLSIILLFINILFKDKFNITKEDNLLKVAYLSNITELNTKYNNLINSNINVIESEGNNLYLIIPSNDIEVNIYDNKELLKTTNKPFVIKCNNNIIISFNYDNKNYEYNPSIKDNKLNTINTNNVIKDITKYD